MSESLRIALDELREAVAVYDAKLAEYMDPDYNGCRPGFGGVRNRVMQAAQAVAAECA